MNDGSAPTPPPAHRLAREEHVVAGHPRAEAIYASFDAAVAAGKLARVTDTVQRLTGGRPSHSPTSCAPAAPS